MLRLALLLAWSGPARAADCPQADTFPTLAAAPENADYADPALAARCDDGELVVTSNGIPTCAFVPITPNPLTESSTNRLNVFLQQGLLPLINQLLQEADPIPFYAQRILSAILDRNQSFVALMRELGAGATPSGKQLKSLIQVICEFYMVNHPSLNKNTIKIMKALIDAKEMSFSELREYRIIDKTY